MKYTIFICLLAFGVAEVNGQSAQVEFYVSGQDSSTLSVLELICASSTDTSTYRFDGKQHITASIEEGTTCQLSYMGEVSVRPKYAYHFDQIDSNGFLRAMSENLRTGERRIFGTKVQLLRQERVERNANQDSMEGAVPTVQTIPVQQLGVALQIDVSNDLPERNDPIIRSCRGGVVTYIDGIPVKTRSGSRAVASFSEVLLFPKGLGVPAEFESEIDANRNQ